MRRALIRAGLSAVLLIPLALAAASPLLAYREPVYILAGFAGIIAMGMLLVQPVLAAGLLPGVSILQGRRIHRWTGIALLGAVLLHVGGLWITSPPDVIDVLLLRSPTPFSIWGLLAMWALLATALLAALRLRLRPRRWRLAHGALGAIIVAGSIAHALLIEGTMEPISKALLCAAAAVATVMALSRLKLRPKRSGT